MSLMTPARMQQLFDLNASWWSAYAQAWNKGIVLYAGIRELLTRAACAWAGVPLAESEVERRTREIRALFDYAGRIGPKHWWSRIARQAAEHWIEDIR